MSKKVIFFLIYIVLLLAVAAGAYYIGSQQGKKIGYDVGIEAAEKSYQELIDKAIIPGINPTENLPTTNPFEGAKTNPFEGVYKNPFK